MRLALLIDDGSPGAIQSQNSKRGHCAPSLRVSFPLEASTDTIRIMRTPLIPVLFLGAACGFAPVPEVAAPSGRRMAQSNEGRSPTTPNKEKRRGSVAPEYMHAVAPALADYTDNVLYGDVWARPNLTPRDRSLVTLAVLISTGKTAQVRGHSGRALTNGVRPQEIAGIATHLAFYAGWPSVVSSLKVIEQVFVERAIAAAVRADTAAPSPPPSASKATSKGSESPHDAQIAPKLVELTQKVLNDDLWLRSDLSPRDRSLVTIASLAANGATNELRFHLQRGLDNGLTRAEIDEAFTHLAFYAGWPNAMSAATVAANTYRAQGQGSSPLQIFPPGARPTPGSLTHFTGSALVSSRFEVTGRALRGGTVRFEAGGHSNWHTHPFGQLLIIQSGKGWVQFEGGPVQEVEPGDVVWTAAGIKHWHGATRTSSMTHVAVSEALNGTTVHWLEPVTDAEYQGPQ